MTVQLTKGTEYGTRGVLHLAKLPPNSVVLVSEIAAAEELPESYLAKIFQYLAKEGIVRSHRGAKGGFSLARSADQITLREVIEAIEGPIALYRCLHPFEGCERAGDCAIYTVIAQAQAQLVAVLDGTTLDDLARGRSPDLFLSAVAGPAD
jgi:Rrf2 family iron-sulfur cluster assembly transcriptional regulator